MNKKQLAKLLIKHLEIKALYESREFDASTINKVIAEEIMSEQDDEEGRGDDPRSQQERDVAAEIDDDELQDLSIDAEDSYSEWVEILKNGDKKEVEKAIKDFRSVYPQMIKAYDSKSPAIFGGKLNKAKREFKSLERLVTKANKRLEGESNSSSKEDAAKKEMIQSIKSEIEFLKTLLNDPNEAPLDKEEYKSTIDEYTKKLEQMGVEVAKTDSLEDDKAFVQSLQDTKPEIQQAVSAVSAAEEDNFSEKFADLDAAIMASLQKSKDAAATANDELDLSDIEVVDDKSASESGDDTPTDTEQSPINKALQWLETEEASQLFQDPFGNANDIEDALKKVGLNTLRDVDIINIRGYSLEDVRDYLKSKLPTTDDSGATEDGDSAKEPEATPEGTQAAVDAIESGDTEDVTNIDPADVQAAKEKLAPEIEADSEMQANAEELKTKVEKDKMAKERKLEALKGVSQIDKAFEKAKVNIEKRIEASKSGDEAAMAQLPGMNEILAGPIQAMQETMETISSATSWEDLINANIWPTAIKNRKDANKLPDFQKWKTDNIKDMQDRFGELRDSLGNVDISTEEGLESLQDSLGDAAVIVGNAIQNSDASSEESGEDADGADVQGQSDLETIAKILPDLKGKFPNLFKFDGFVKNLEQALMNAEPSSDATDTDGEGVDASGTASKSDTNLSSDISSGEEEQTTGNVGGLEEALSGIYLAEEGEATSDTDNAGNERTGEPLDVADATTLRQELEALRDALKPKSINVDDLLTPELKKALGMEVEPTEETSEIPTTEEATQEGQDAALADSEKEDMRYQDLYAGFKKQMDTFFSVDGKNDGFMDQFLLKYQAAKLAELISNLDQIIRGDVPKDGEDNEGEARAFSTATQQADANLQAEAQGEAISEKGQIELKTRLVAMLKGLKSLRAMMNSYKENATRSSANPALDGSALKKSLQRYMSNLQINIKAIVETCYIEHSKLTKTKSDDVNLDEPANDEVATPSGDDTAQNLEDPQPSVQSEQLYEAILEAIAPALDGIYLMEDAAREEKMALVNETYGAMMEIYEGSMRSALEKAQKQTAMKNASQMMELAKKEEFVALFPTFVGSFGGKPQTISQATDAIDKLLREFVETMKKVIVLAKGATIDETTLAKVIEDLSMMSLMMQNYFGVKSLLDDEMQARVEKMLAQREENQSFTDVPKPATERSSGNFMDTAKDLVGKGLEKLKQMFGWMSEETMKFLLKFFGEDSELLAKLEQSDLEESEQEELLNDVTESVGFLQSLEQKQVDAINKLFIDMGKRGAQLAEEVFKFSNVRDFEVQFSKNFDEKIKKILFTSMNKALSEEERSLVVDLMRSKQDEFVLFMTSFFKVKEKLGNEASEELINATPDPSKRNADKPPVSADVELDDAEDEVTGIEGNDGAITADLWDPDDEEDDTDKKIQKIKEDIQKLPQTFVKYAPLIYDLLKVSKITDFVINKNLGVPFLAYVAKINDFLNGTHNEMGYELDNIIRTDTEMPQDRIQLTKKKAQVDYENFINLANSIYNINFTNPQDEDKVLKAILLAQQQVQQVNDDGIFSDYNKELLKDPILEMTPQIQSTLLVKMKKFNDEQAKVKTDNPSNQADLALQQPIQDNNLEESLKPIIEKMLKEHYNH